MKLTNFDEDVHILDKHTDVWSFIKEVAEDGHQEDAFHVLDVGELVRNHQNWLRMMPRVEPHYAVKCNDNLTVLEILAALGLGFDCASKSDLVKVLSLGVQPERIIFANPAKLNSHIQYASNAGVDLMTFDNESELKKIKKLHPTARMVLRIRCDASDAICNLGPKYGCDPISEGPYLLDKAKKLGVKVVGISFHVGSGCNEPEVYRRAIATARNLFDYAFKELEQTFDLLDIGGGFLGSQDPRSFQNIAEIINGALQDFFPDVNGVRVIAEPGRYYVNAAFTLACTIHTIRKTSCNDPRMIHYMYYVNDGVYGSFNGILYENRKVFPLPLKEYHGNDVFNSSIWGPTCDSLDRIVEKVTLPKMKEGDWIVFKDMGAYSVTIATEFNGFPIPKVHLVADEEVWMVLQHLLPTYQGIPFQPSIQFNNHKEFELYAVD